MSKDYKYQVAISFAEEDRNIALCLALAFELAGVNDIYYYPDQMKDTVGHDLQQRLQQIYAKQARYAILIASEQYFRKTYTRVELKAIAERMQLEKDYVYMIPVMTVQHSKDKHLLKISKLSYVQWTHNPKEIVQLLLDKLGRNQQPDNKLATELLLQLACFNEQQATQQHLQRKMLWGIAFVLALILAGFWALWAGDKKTETSNKQRGTNIISDSGVQVNQQSSGINSPNIHSKDATVTYNGVPLDNKTDSIVNRDSSSKR